MKIYNQAMMKIYAYISIFLQFFIFFINSQSISTFDLIQLRNNTKSSFLFAFNSYMTYGFPYDEVKPMSCSPRRYIDRSRGNIDDILSDSMLTLIDSLDTMIIIGEYDLFQTSIQYIQRYQLNFDKDMNISVFEMNIRILGGLLSAHQLASLYYTDYDGFLLKYAEDIGRRLLPAFNTKTFIPVHRVNLKYGKIIDETNITCTAAGATYLLEMSVLSQLTGNSTYQKAGMKALTNLWKRRSSLNLVRFLINSFPCIYL